MFKFEKMFRFEKPQRLPCCYWLTLPALFPLLYMSIVYEFRIYEMLFWVEVEDTYPQYPGISAQAGVKSALRHINEYFPWYRYSAIVFIVSYYFSPIFCVSYQGILGFLKLYFKVFLVYFLSVFISMIIYIIFIEINFGSGLGKILWGLMITIPAAIFYTFCVFAGCSEVYAPYALPAVFASVFVAAGIFIFKPNNKIKPTQKDARLI